MPDLSIETVMGEPARATPAHVYVSLDSAPTAQERVDLALAEMERVGAFDRSLIMLVSPTGTGYVNYVAVAAAAYLTRGDVATVTMQYSKRPSPLSLGKVKDAREQNRLPVAAHRRAAARPPRPAAAGRGLRREPRGAHQPGRLPALGDAGPAGARHRARAVDRHAVPQRLDARGDRPAPARRGRGQRRRRQRLRPARGARRGAPRPRCGSSWSATTTTGSPSSART